MIRETWPLMLYHQEMSQYHRRIMECRISQYERNGVKQYDKICLPVYQLILCPRQRMNHKMHWSHIWRPYPVLRKISKSTLKHLIKIHHYSSRTKEHHLKFSCNHHISRGFFRVRFSFSNTCESVHDEKRKKISTWLLRLKCWQPCHYHRSSVVDGCTEK